MNLTMLLAVMGAFSRLTSASAQRGDWRQLRCSCKSKALPPYFHRELRRPPRQAFISAFQFNTQSTAPRTTVQSASNTCPRVSRRSISVSKSCAPANDPAINVEEILSRRIPPGITIHDALRSSIQLLEERSIPEPEESALHLLAYALGMSWENGYRQLREVLMLPKLDLAQQTLSADQCITYQSLISRRLQHEPLQYIVGQWDFHYLSGLKVRKPMLCPRPETEELVEFVLADIDRLIKHQTPVGEERKRKIRVLDVGCGTGAIGIAIARQYPEYVQVVALDVSPEAVELSNENAAEFLSGLVGENGKVHDLYQAVLCSAKDFTNDNSSDNASQIVEQRHQMDFDIIVSNPPYIPANDMQELSTDVVGFESHGALCGGDDGLDVIRDIVSRLLEWVSPPGDVERIVGEQRHCWMEVDDSHPSILAEWLAPGSEESSRWGMVYCESRKDFCGRDRFVKLKVVG